jgi:hypothetical protein
MDAIYKYLPRRYAIQLVQGTSILVGTLQRFRQMEKRDAERGDAGEGTRRIRAVVNGPPNEFTQQFIHIEGAKNVSFHGVHFEGTFGMNAYIYCMSSVCSRATMALFRGTDTCVRISDPVSFFEAVEGALRISAHVSINNREMGKVLYGGRNYQLEKLPGVSAAFEKPPRYRKQYEVRMVYMTNDPIPGPLIVACHDAAKHCSIMDVVPK